MLGNSKTVYNRAYLASICFTGFILMICLLLGPAFVPAPLRSLHLWVRMHWTSFLWAIAALTFVDVVLSFDRFQNRTNQRMKALEKQVSELKNRQP
jgi:hypothetical protein